MHDCRRSVQRLPPATGPYSTPGLMVVGGGGWKSFKEFSERRREFLYGRRWVMGEDGVTGRDAATRDGGEPNAINKPLTSCQLQLGSSVDPHPMPEP